MISLFSLLFESNTNIVALGFPEVIASILSEKFGKHSFLIAKWLREYDSYKSPPVAGNDGSISYPENWWRRAYISHTGNSIDLVGLVEAFEAAKISEEKYREVMKSHGFRGDGEFNQSEMLSFLKREITEEMNKGVFFRSTIVQDIQSGKLTDLKPYKTLAFQEAKDKYDKKLVFKNPGRVIKQYDNGWRWIDAGSKCQLVGNLMKNCGSTGVMSLDADSTMLTLFDPKNKPHVVVTYSPNEKRISGDEGIGSSEPKEKYHDYIIDVANHLKANFDYDKSKSTILKLKGALQNQFKEIKPIKEGLFQKLYKIIMNDNSVYYTDSYSFVSHQTIEELAKEEFDGDLSKAIEKAFNHYKNLDIPKIYLAKFIEGSR